MPHALRYIAACLVSLLLLPACSPTDAEEASPQAQRFAPAVPANLAAAVPYPERNPFTVEGVELGRMLFYDPILSGSNSISCASCHQQDKAFSDGVALSTAGASGKPLLRHAPALVNLAWAEGWFWDGGAKDIESLAFGPLSHPDEMNQDLQELTQELQRHAVYPRLFRLAFGSDSITAATIARALAQFQRTLISANSRYDKYVRGEGGTLSSLELEGLELFKEHCASCHSSDFFTDYGYHNNGLDATFPDEHEELAFGRGRISLQAADIGKYKTPTLRNIALTAPYMHDGRFATLQQVLAHYQRGVQASETLAPQLRQANGKLGIPLTDAEKEKIILFLNTLTDEAFVQNKAFSNPF